MLCCDSACSTVTAAGEGHGPRCVARCAELRFYTCGEPIDRDGGGSATPAPFSFEAGMAAAKAQVSTPTDWFCYVEWVYDDSVELAVRSNMEGQP